MPRVLLCSIAAFVLPVCLAVLSAPALFNSNVHTPLEYARARLHPIAQPTALEFEPPGVVGPTPFREIHESANVDPQESGAFLVSALVRFSKLPEVGKRERLFYKYAIQQQPYAGWALAVRRWPGSLRPEVYWRDASGKGGWFAFNDVNLEAAQWYRFTFVVEDGIALSLYVSEAEQDPFSEGFVGGLAIEEIAAPHSVDSLFIAPLVEQTDSAQIAPVEAAELVVAELSAERLKWIRSSRAARKNAVIAERLEQSEVKLLLTPESSLRS